jgi:hypothetical protein
MKLEVIAIGKILIVKDEAGTDIAAGSPRQIANALAARFETLLTKAEA